MDYLLQSKEELNVSTIYFIDFEEIITIVELDFNNH